VYGSDGSVLGLSSTFTADLTSLAKLAEESKVVLQICLWSFDMCKKGEAPGDPHADLISNVTKTDGYIANALEPMLVALKSSPNVLIEVINEPEWCMHGPGNTDVQVAPAEMQRFVAKIAAAVHKHGKKVTVGSASLKWNSDGGSGEINYWSDSALKLAYSSAGAHLDHYQIHYYDWMYNDRWGYDPCRQNATVAYWKLDKPTVVGELMATSKHYTSSQMLKCAFDHGFIGDMFWAYNDPKFPVAAALPALKESAAQHSDISSYATLIAWLASANPQ
jgi:hypothetical protein